MFIQITKDFSSPDRPCENVQKGCDTTQTASTHLRDSSIAAARGGGRSINKNIY
jgi:hypothetical protein